MNEMTVREKLRKMMHLNLVIFSANKNLQNFRSQLRFSAHVTLLTIKPCHLQQFNSLLMISLHNNFYFDNS